MGIELSTRDIRRIRGLCFGVSILLLIGAMSLCLGVGAYCLQQSFFSPGWALDMDPGLLRWKGTLWTTAGVGMFLSVFLMAGLE